MTRILLTDVVEEVADIFVEEVSEIISEEVTIEPGVIKNFFEELPEQAFHFGLKLLGAALFLFIGLRLIKLVRRIVGRSMERANADTGVIQFVDSFVRVALYIILFLMLATSFGLQATSIVALVGSAGVAIGLALQGSLSNFAGGVLILLLKPFKVGDYIVDSKEHEGTVEEIQLFYTKLITPENKVVIIPNGELSNESITNVTAGQVRRLDVTVSIAYDSDIKKAKDTLLNVISEDEFTLKDKDLLVFVDELADSGIIMHVRCWFNCEDYWPGKWRITENCKYALDEAGIVIPFPQMDVHVKNVKEQ